MTIRELRILPPFAIGRLGSASEPLDNYTLEDDPDHPLEFRRIKVTETLIVDEATGEISGSRTRPPITLKDKAGRIRPVAPFLEVFAVMDNGKLQALTSELLDAEGKLEWCVTVANRKVARRTGNPDDEVEAKTDWFSSYEPKRLEGHSSNFISKEKFIDFGHVRYIKPNKKYPEIRLRFTPAKGLIYGSKPTTESDEPDANVYVVPEDRAIYDGNKGWYKYEVDPGLAKEAADYTGDDPDKKKVALEIQRRLAGKPASQARGFTEELASEVERILADDLTPEEKLDRSKRLARETMPPSLFAIHPPAPCWLHDNVAISRGYLDDACDGIVEVRLTRQKGQPPLEAAARICSAPPAVVPDTLFIRHLADDLEQVIHGPGHPTDEPAAETRKRALDIVRRAFETVRFLNVAVMNGNPVMGRNPLDIDTMPAEEAFGTLRLMRPVVPEKTADTLAILALHQQVYAALQAGAAPWFGRLLRQPSQAGDYTDSGRRKMPAMMCGADGNYLALTHRQINTIFRAAELPMDSRAADNQITDKTSPAEKLTPRNNSAQLHRDLHYTAAGNPICTTPVASVGNCTPGLEVDLRAAWRRLFDGIVLREWDNLVVEMDRSVKDPRIWDLTGHRLLRVNEVQMMTQMIGPSPEDPVTRSAVLATDANPHGLAPLEWSNALAKVVHEFEGKDVRCDFTKEAVWQNQQPWTGDEGTYISVLLRVRPFFEGETAVISRALAQPGELTQGLCSPWQNDYRECSCYYWASARPDFVNVEASPSGESIGDNWLQKKRTGEYVADDYVDDRLINYDDLFREWEKLLRFQVRGRDHRDTPQNDTAQDDG